MGNGRHEAEAHLLAATGLKYRIEGGAMTTREGDGNAINDLYEGWRAFVGANICVG